MIEKRKHKRLPIEMAVEFKKQDGETYKGMSKNISFGGMRIHFTQKPDIAIGDNCEIFLILQEKDRIALEFDAVVVYMQDMSMGIQFVAINAEHYEHFKNLMVVNSKDPGKLLEELNRHPGLVIR